MRIFWIGLCLVSVLSLTVTAQSSLTEPALTLTDDAKVGVRTTTPQAPLEVNGETRVGKLASNQGKSPTLGNDEGADFLITNLVTDDEGRIAFRNATDGTWWGLQGEAFAYKNFIINHPVAKERFLVHANLEGPEAAVFYRGSAKLRDGRAEIELPDYFEALTRQEGRTIILTNVDGFDRLAVKRRHGLKIRNGSFLVISENPQSQQEFDWEVKAVRADGPPLKVEPARDSIDIISFGPYRSYRERPTAEQPEPTP
ncbi:hypothetical protein [Acanthopleuribacter pedis]|uniref:Uncharacterized protein n=1 Tax=Acanthopleuribacter pedis TaxID=442870 RepID=A0A8J7QA80_9BACT|nr:hypothetical protein [Acanthopleuribacter pedis]MBO1321661.1 hypothetical protein [Acanthopleuribacter pedis]